MPASASERWIELTNVIAAAQERGYWDGLPSLAIRRPLAAQDQIELASFCASDKAYPVHHVSEPAIRPDSNTPRSAPCSTPREELALDHVHAQTRDLDRPLNDSFNSNAHSKAATKGLITELDASESTSQSSRPCESPDSQEPALSTLVSSSKPSNMTCYFQLKL